MQNLERGTGKRIGNREGFYMCVSCVRDSISEWQTCVASKERARRMGLQKKRETVEVLDELITGIGHGMTHEFATYLRANESKGEHAHTDNSRLSFLALL